SGLTARSRLLARRGGRDIKRNIAKPPLMERTGWWFKINRNVFEPDPPPRLRHFGAFAPFLTGAATPPGQEGRSRGSLDVLEELLVLQTNLVDQVCIDNDALLQ